MFQKLRSTDMLLHIAACVLLLFGTAAIYSVALSQEGSDFLFFKKHLVAVGIGLVVFVLLSVSNYRFLRNYSLVLYVGCIGLMIAVLFFGDTIRGTTGWFSFGPLHLQPVELMKIALAVALATYFTSRARCEFHIREFLESGAIAGVPVVLTLAQPDVGSASLLCGLWLVVALFAGLKKRHILILVLTLVVSFSVGWFFLFAPYQKARLETFIDPSIDPLGQGYNITQAIIAVGAGQWFGRGLGFGSQSQLKFLPESQTDFVFAVIAEELGFLGVTIVLCAFFLLFFRVWSLAKNTRQNFSGFLLISMGAVLFCQFFVNVGMNLGVLPVTGVGLPFVSYGGSSLLASLAMLGIVQSTVVS